jgi:hypothetical protein
MGYFWVADRSMENYQSHPSDNRHSSADILQCWQQNQVAKVIFKSKKNSQNPAHSCDQDQQVWNIMLYFLEPCAIN